MNAAAACGACAILMVTFNSTTAVAASQPDDATLRHRTRLSTGPTDAYAATFFTFFGEDSARRAFTDCAPGDVWVSEDGIYTMAADDHWVPWSTDVAVSHPLFPERRLVFTGISPSLQYATQSLQRNYRSRWVDARSLLSPTHANLNYDQLTASDIQWILLSVHAPALHHFTTGTAENGEHLRAAAPKGAASQHVSNEGPDIENSSHKASASVRAPWPSTTQNSIGPVNQYVFSRRKAAPV